MYAAAFQSLSGIMERSHTDFNKPCHSGLFWRFNPFQGLWNVLTEKVRWKNLQSKCFNPFQGLWNVLTGEEISKATKEAVFQSLSGIMERSHLAWGSGRWWSADVSIPFRDYGTFSPRRWLHENWNHSWCFNPFQGLWNVLTRCFSIAW